MTRAKWIYFASMIASILLAVRIEAAPPAPLEAGIRDYLDPLLRTNNFSGVVLVAKGDEIVFQQGYGFASVEHQVRNRPQTVFQIASVSKPFTAAAILLLAEQGKIGLDAPLTRILPDYPDGDRLTIHHLLTHSSGIPNINDLPEYEELQSRRSTPAELVAVFRGKPLEFEPGSRYSYSNSNYNLLALIIEKASGKSYGSFVKAAILDPLKLERTGHPESAAEIVPDLAAGYAPEGSLGLARAPYLDWSVKTGNGSLRSDAAGVFRFMRGVHAGRLLSPASVRRSFTPHQPNVGYGWFLTRANGRELHHANGRSPGWAAQADHYPADQVTIVVLANLYISVTTDIARAVGALYFGEKVEPLPALRPEPLAPARAAALVGSYQFGPDYYVPDALIEVRTRGGHLEAAIGDYPPFPFVPISDTRFVIRPYWVSAEFELGPDGKAAALSIDGRKGARVADGAR